LWNLLWGNTSRRAKPLVSTTIGCTLHCTSFQCVNQVHPPSITVPDDPPEWGTHVRHGPAAWRAADLRQVHRSATTAHARRTGQHAEQGSCQGTMQALRANVCQQKHFKCLACVPSETRASRWCASRHTLSCASSQHARSYSPPPLPLSRLLPQTGAPETQGNTVPVFSRASSDVAAIAALVLPQPLTTTTNSKKQRHKARPYLYSLVPAGGVPASSSAVPPHSTHSPTGAQGATPGGCRGRSCWHHTCGTGHLQATNAPAESWIHSEPQICYRRKAGRLYGTIWMPHA
jgi:hypothetical protein